MARETGPDTRVKPTLLRRAIASDGVFRTRKFDVTDVESTETVSDKVSFMTIKNTGVSTIQLRHDGAATPQFYPIDAGEKIQNIPVADGVKLKLKCATGLSSTLRCIFTG